MLVLFIIHNSSVELYNMPGVPRVSRFIKYTYLLGMVYVLHMPGVQSGVTKTAVEEGRG